MVMILGTPCKTTVTKRETSSRTGWQMKDSLVIITIQYQPLITLVKRAPTPLPDASEAVLQCGIWCGVVLYLPRC